MRLLCSMGKEFTRKAFNKSKYAKIKPSVEDVKLGISLYGDTVIYVKGRLKWFNLLKYFWFV